MNPNDKDIPGPQVVFALYRPHEGKDAELRGLIADHVPALRRLELITDRPTILMKSSNGTYLEIFEWRSHAAAGQVRQHPELANIWEAMGKIADLPNLDSLEETKRRFPHFAPVTL
jgi:hypothetical protein